MVLGLDGINKTGGLKFSANVDATSASGLPSSSSLGASRVDENSMVSFNPEDKNEEEKTMVANAKKEIENEQAKIEQIAKDVELANNELEALYEKLKAKTDESQNLRTKLASAATEEERAEIQAKIDELEGPIGSLNDDITSKIGEITSLTDSYEDATNSLDEAIQNYNTLVSTVQMSAEARKQEQEALKAMQNSASAGAPNSFGLNSVAPSPAPENLLKMGYNPQKGAQLASAALGTGSSMGSTGWCYAGVIQSLAKVGVGGLYGESAYMAADQLAQRGDFAEMTGGGWASNTEILSSLPAGAVVVWNRSDVNIHGHISVSIGDGREASDHTTGQYTNCGNGTFRVFLPK